MLCRYNAEHKFKRAAEYFFSRSSVGHEPFFADQPANYIKILQMKDSVKSEELRL